MSDFDKISKEIQAYLDTTVYTVIGVEAVNFFRDNFQRQGFLDKTVAKWKPVKESTLKRKRNKETILHESGNLKRSIRWKRSGSNTVIIYNDEPYAEIHNEGGRITGVYKVNEHYRRTKDDEVKVKAHNRNVNTEIPQRQFMGYSKALMTHLEDMIAKDIMKIIDKHAKPI